MAEPQHSSIPSSRSSASAAAAPRRIQQVGRYVHGDGRKLFLLENTVADARGNVILISPFGRTVHDLFLLANFLTHNGFNVFRFDPRDHDGLSDGAMEDFTLPGLQRDTELAANAFQRAPGVPTLVLGMSLSFPVALKYAASTRDVSAIISVVGVVDLEDTLNKVVGFHPREYRKSPVTAPSFVEPFCCKIRAHNFVHTMDEGRYATRADVERYLRELDKPLYMLAAADDEYVSIEAVESVFRLHGHGGQLERLVGVSHEIGRSIGAAKFVAGRVVEYALLSIRESGARIPTLVEAIADSQRETEYLNTFK
jgi:pimeloyl-ACP methyl ester carboxylesterase